MPSAVPWGRTDVGSASAPEPDLAACNKEADLRALVTGRAGFVGSTLVDRLIAEGHEVTVVDDLSRGNMRNPHEASDRISFVRADVQDADLIDVMAKAQPEVGFHLAAQIDVRESVVDPATDARINILGTINVAEAARAVGVRKIVFTCRAARSTAPPPTCRCPRRHPSTRCRRMRCQRRALPQRVGIAGVTTLGPRCRPAISSTLSLLGSAVQRTTPSMLPLGSEACATRLSTRHVPAENSAGRRSSI